MTEDITITKAIITMKIGTLEIAKGQTIIVTGYKQSGREIVRKCEVAEVTSNLGCRIYYNGEYAELSKIGDSYQISRQWMRILLVNVTVKESK